MSAYNNFTKTSYGGAGGDDSGGFMTGGSQQGSQGGGKAYQDESLRPVTIKQILDAEDINTGTEFKVDGATVTQITFVGQIRNINPQPTNVTFRIDDGTGQIDVKKWVDADVPSDDANSEYEIDGHVRVWGRVKSFSNKRHVAAHVLRPVQDFNEVNYHMLEATYVHLYFTKGPLGQNGAANGNGDSMFVDGGNGYNNGATGGNAGSSKLVSCSPTAKKMFNFMSSTSGGNEGFHLNVMTSQTGMSVRDVLSAADELLGQGLIYTTVDDETWAILEY